MDNTSPPPPPHVILVPTPGMGHLIPFAELAKRLIPKFTITIAIPTTEPPSSTHLSFLAALPSGIDSVFLPPVDLSAAPSDAKPETLINLTAALSLPHLRQLISDLLAAGRHHLVSLVVDVFGTDAFEVAAEFELRPYVFFSSNATCLSLFLHLQNLHDTVSGEYAEMLEPVQLPGCVPLQGKDLLRSVQDRKNDAYKWVLHHSNRYKLAEGILVNSFDALEPGPIKELSRGGPPVYPIGPLIKRAGSGEPTECLKWLDEQPRRSVLFVSFGSGGSLEGQQQNELALGLEKSGQRFLWVIRTPKGSVYQPDPLKSLPEGFQERTKGRGFVIPNWAPQVEVLSHGWTGGFLSHCGWNSTLESVVNGVPLITWPLYAEQKMNAVLLTKELKVGLRPEAGPDGVVSGDEIAKVVAELMEGEEGMKIRVRVKELKDAASVALNKDGSSSKTLNEISKKWSSK